jgi:hypothetical protein
MNRYFVLLNNKATIDRLMEVDEPLYQWLRNLGLSDVRTGEPNLLIIEKYQDSMYIIGNKEEKAYAGLAGINGDTLVRSYHYFIHVRATKQKSLRQKPFLIKELKPQTEITNQPAK